MAGTAAQVETAAQAGTVAAQLGGALINAGGADVGRHREAARQRRLRTVAVVLGVPAAYLWYRIIVGSPVNLLALPSLPTDPYLYILPLFLLTILIVIVGMPLASGRSPHVRYGPEQIDVALDDVVGIDPIVEEVTKTLNTFLGHALYRGRLGGNPRRGLLFEGPPGTGKTHLAKAMARHAGVPFFFVSATSFQSMWYGATARKIRAYFRQLRRAARREGGAVGFIEEIDAIATTRGGLNSAPRSLAPMVANRLGTAEGTGGIVNELLVQMQSFDTPPAGDRIWNAAAGALNAFLPADRQIAMRRAPYTNVLLIAATNRGDALDPALLRPGRFDRRLTFELPAKSARRALIDHFLDRKAHHPELDGDARRDQLAAQTFGYTPVMIEHLLDEALVVALRGGRDALSWSDVADARLTGEIGLRNPVTYTDRERRTVATHEAGHAVVAYLSATRRLEVCSIVKRRGSLGLLAHGDLDEVYTRTRAEMVALVDIAMGGLCAEELWFGEAGTGPSSDLAYATTTACEVVGAAGMAGSLVSLAAVQHSAFNDTNLAGRVLADPFTRPEVDRLLNESRDRVRNRLDTNRHLVEALRDALLERDELVGDDITAVLEAAGPPVLDDLRLEQSSEASDARR